MRIKTGQGTIPLITLIGIWSISALNALPGLAVSPILGKLVRHIPPLDRTGYTNVIIPAFAADYTFYYIIGEADGKGQQHLVVTNRIEYLRCQRSIVSAVNQDVAADCSECLAGQSVRD